MGRKWSKCAPLATPRIAADPRQHQIGAHCKQSCCLVLWHLLRILHDLPDTTRLVIRRRVRCSIHKLIHKHECWMRHGCGTTHPPPPPLPIFAMSCHIPCVPHEGHMLRPMPALVRRFDRLVFFLFFAGRRVRTQWLAAVVTWVIAVHGWFHAHHDSQSCSAMCSSWALTVRLVAGAAKQVVKYNTRKQHISANSRHR